MQHTSSKNSFMKFELTVYVHKFNCDGDVLVVMISSNVGLLWGDDGVMIDNAFSECLLDTNVNWLSSIFNVYFWCIIIHLQLWIISTPDDNKLLNNRSWWPMADSSLCTDDIYYDDIRYLYNIKLVSFDFRFSMMKNWSKRRTARWKK